MTDSQIDAQQREPQPGDILLFTHARNFNRLITWLTRSNFYHVAIYEGNGNVIEARPRGVVRRDLNGPDGDKCYVVIPAPENKGQAALKWAQTRLGEGYDNLSAAVITLEQLFQHLHINYTSYDAFSCGELVARAYTSASADLFPGRKPESVVAADFEPFLPDDAVLPPESDVQDSDWQLWGLAGLLLLLGGWFWLLKTKRR